MLSLLLDENLSSEIADQIAAKRADILLTSLDYWHEGQYKGHSDEAILSAAAREGVTLVTYDQRTILPLLMRWGAAGTDHAGVVFVDNFTIASNNFGGLVRALIALWDASHADNWTNRVDFLRPS